MGAVKFTNYDLRGTNCRVPDGAGAGCVQGDAEAVCGKGERGGRIVGAVDAGPSRPLATTDVTFYLHLWSTAPKGHPRWTTLALRFGVAPLARPSRRFPLCPGNSLYVPAKKEKIFFGRDRVHGANGIGRGS